MAADLLTTAKSVLKRLGEVVAQDAELRLRLGELVRAVLALAEEPGATVASDVAAAAPPAAPIEAEPSSLAPPPSSARPAVPPAQPVLPPLAPPVAEATEAPAEVERSAAVPMGFWQPVGDEELPDMEQRCLLKAQAAQWAVQRLRLLRDG